MKRILVILILLTLGFGLKAQSILPIGNSEFEQILLTEAVGEQIYAITYNDRDGEYRLAHFDLVEWNDLGSLPTLPKDGKYDGDEFHLSDLTYFKGNLYLCGSFVYEPGEPHKNVALKWDGTSWSDISSDLITNSRQLTKYLIYNDQIIIVGIFSSVQSVNLLTYAQGNWSPLGDFGTYDAWEDQITDAFYWKNKIYASGVFSKPGTAGKRFLMSFDGTNWTFNVSPPFLHENSYFALHDGHLVLTGTPNAPTVSDFDYFKRFDGRGTSWEDYSSGLKGIKIDEVKSMESDGEILWVSGDFIDKDEKDTFHLLYNKNGLWYKAETPLKDAVGLSYWNKQAIAFGDYKIQGVKCIGALGEGIAYVRGNVFHDDNANCIQDNGEGGTVHHELVLEPGGHKILTNSDGSFAFPVKKGEYSLTIKTGPFWATSCGETVFFTANEHINLSQISYGMTKVPGKLDIEAYLHDFKGGKVKAGNQERFVLEVVNNGTKNAGQFSVQIRIKPASANASFSVQPTSYIDGVATWDIASLNELEQKFIEIYVDIPSGENNFCMIYDLLLTDGMDDVVKGNNRDSISYTTYQKDENFWKTSKMGELLDPETSELGYDIYFRNATTGMVNKILVIDTLDRDVVLIGSQAYAYPEHDGFEIESKLINGRYQRIFKWIYTSAELPDSASDPVASVGHISYDLRIPKGSLPPFGDICNEAQIFMENLEPLVTNEVCSQVNTTGITTPELDRLHIYPNPTMGEIKVNNVLDESMELHIQSIDGRDIMVLDAPAFEETTFDLSDLGKGVYFIRAKGFVAHKIILQ